MLLALPGVAQAQITKVEETKDWGYSLELRDVVDNVVGVLQKTIVPLGIAMFILGAFLYVVSVNREETKNLGKGFMIGSLIGVGVVMAAKAILNLVMHIIYGT